MTSPIPIEALANHIAILGKTGSGKSNAAKTLAEDALDRGDRVCVIDPTGTWYGLRLTRKGAPSPYKVVIFGGKHGDLPIGAAHGAAIAETVGTTSTPAVIDTRLMTVGARTQFFTDFAEALLRTNQGPLTLIIDEAHLFAPQGRVNDPKSGAMVHAANNLVSLGRGLGLRIILISQRPAKLHKDSLTQVETLVAMRLIAPHDRDAVRDWIREAADLDHGKEIMTSLPSMPTGDAWVWSPELGVLHRAKFRLASTFDSGSAKAQSDAPSLAPLDIDAVTARLKEVAADVVASDPKALKAEVARLTRDLAKAQKAAIVAPPVSAPVVANADAIEEARALGERIGFAAGVNAARDALAGLSPDAAPMPRQRGPQPQAEPREAAVPVVAADGVTVPQQRVLNALAWWAAFGIKAPASEQVAFVAGYSASSSGYANLKGAMRSAGLIEYPAGGKVALTTAGLELADAPDSSEVSQDAFHRQVRAKLSGPQQRLLNPLIAAYPDALSSSALALAADYSPSSSGYANLKGQMRTLGFLDYPSPGQVRAADWLFPERT